MVASGGLVGVRGAFWVPSDGFSVNLSKIYHILDFDTVCGVRFQQFVEICAPYGPLLSNQELKY